MRAVYKKVYFRIFIAIFALWISAFSMTLAFSLAFGFHAQSDKNIKNFALAIEKYKVDEDFLAFEKSIETLDITKVVNNKLPEVKSYRKRALASAANVITLEPKLIEIPSLKKSLPVSNPKTRDINKLNAILQKAVVRYPGTALLGSSSGNMIIFGHSSHLPVVRNKMYKAFNDIERLKKNDIIVLKDKNGKKWYYYVKRVYRAKASESSIVVNTKEKRLTLITCDNFGAKEDRWIVEAVAY